MSIELAKIKLDREKAKLRKLRFWLGLCIAAIVLGVLIMPIALFFPWILFYTIPSVAVGWYYAYTLTHKTERRDNIYRSKIEVGVRLVEIYEERYFEEKELESKRIQQELEKFELAQRLRKDSDAR